MIMLQVADANIGTFGEMFASNVFPAYGTELIGVAIILFFAYFIWKKDIPLAFVIPCGLLITYSLSILFGTIWNTIYLIYLALAVGGLVAYAVLKIVSRIY